MKKNCFILLLLSVAAIQSCGVYSRYQNPDPAGEEVSVESFSKWQEFYSDPFLQELLDSAIAHNTDLATAGLRLSQADESLKASKLAYIPSLFFSPNGGISVKSGQAPDYTYNVPLSIGWNFGSPGTLFARRHQAEARRIQAQDYFNATRNELISQVAADYYMLQMLDEKVVILENTISVWTKALEIQREFMLSGKTFYSSVAQMESKLIDAKQDLLQVKADIAVWEKAVCLLTAEPYHNIRRSRNGEFSEPHLDEQEVNLSAIRYRPDVRAAERDLEITYYLTSEAKSAFYPSINLSGDFGWPGLINGVLSLVQPIFAQGSLKCRLNISKMDEEIAQLQFKQTLLQAATEVSQALADYNLYSEKAKLFSEQKQIQDKAFRVVEEMLRDGKANYLELIKAQEKLLSAQLGEAESHYKTREATIELYKSLGR